MELTVVTTVGGNYSQYLGEWGASIAAQTRQPDAVVIVDNGADDPAAVDDVAELLGARLVRLGRKVNYGRARNIAVSHASTEWVQHFDCDDTMFPWALEETEATLVRHPDADVVQWGWRRTVGGKVETRNYRPLDGVQVLRTEAKGSGPSPFRKVLWEQAPYDDLIEAAWDTTLWIGFAHLGATFRPAQRLCFEYRQHADSVFNSRTSDPLKFPLRNRVSERLRLLAAKPLERAVVCMPWRDQGDPHRRRTMEWAKRRWESYGFQVVQHDGGEGDWSVSKARNGAVGLAHARAVLIADADVMVEEDVAWRAVADCFVEPWVVPHRFVHRLSELSTDRMVEVDGDLPVPAGTIRQPYEGVAGGGLVVMTPGQFEAAGGFDERFAGWGAEDEAFGMAAQTLLGRPARYDSPLWHLYHPPGLRQKHPHYPRNSELYREYVAAAGDPAKMAEVVGAKVEDVKTVELPAVFRSKFSHHVVMLPWGRKIKFRDHRYVARDRAVAAWLMYGPSEVELEAAQ